MTAADAQPTLPLPDGFAPEPPAPRRRRVWPWIVAFVIVAALAVVAWFAADAIARQVVTGVVQQQVKSQLSLPAEQQVDVEVAGMVIPQLIGGTLTQLTISSDDVTFDAVSGDVTVVADDVAVRGDVALGGATATVSLDEDQLQQLLSTVDGFPSDTVGIADPNVTMTVDLELFGVSFPVGVALTPSASGGEIVLSPAALQLGSSEVTADELRDQFGRLADVVLRDWNVCIAKYLPAGVTLTGVEVDGDQLVADFDVDGGIVTDPALQENGACA